MDILNHKRSTNCLQPIEKKNIQWKNKNSCFTRNRNTKKKKLKQHKKRKRRKSQWKWRKMENKSTATRRVSMMSFILLLLLYTFIDIYKHTHTHMLLIYDDDKLIMNNFCFTSFGGVKIKDENRSGFFFSSNLIDDCIAWFVPL